METRTKPPGWYWAVAGLALLWALMGCWAYYSQVTISPADFAKLPPAQQDAWRSMPEWVVGVYAVAVWVGLLGALALLGRRNWAGPLYLVSLVAVIVQFGWVFTQTPILTMIGAEAAIFPLFIIAVGAALVWFATLARRRGWTG